MKNLPYSLLCGNPHIPWRRKVPGPRAIQDRPPGPDRRTGLTPVLVGCAAPRWPCLPKWLRIACVAPAENHGENPWGKITEEIPTGEILQFDWGLDWGNWIIFLRDSNREMVLSSDESMRIMDTSWNVWWDVPSCNRTWQWKTPLQKIRFQCKNKSTHWFSIAMFNDRRVRRTDTFSTALVVHMTCEPRFRGWHHE